MCGQQRTVCEAKLKEMIINTPRYCQKEVFQKKKLSNSKRKNPASFKNRCFNWSAQFNNLQDQS